MVVAVRVLRDCGGVAEQLRPVRKRGNVGAAWVSARGGGGADMMCLECGGEMARVDVASWRNSWEEYECCGRKHMSERGELVRTAERRAPDGGGVAVWVWLRIPGGCLCVRGGRAG